MTEDEAWKRLGQLLLSRRVELGYLRRSVFARDLGLSHDRTLFDIENAKRRNFDPSTLAFVEQAYGWRPGSIRTVLGGGDPTVTPRNSEPEVQVDRSSVGASSEDENYVADRGPNDPPGRISDEELLAVIRRQRQELDELERRINGGRPVEGA